MTPRPTTDRLASLLALGCLLLGACASSNDGPAARDTILVQAPTQAGDGVFAVQPDGTLGSLLSPAGTSAKHGDWSPNGKTIIFVDDRDGSLWTMGADGSNPAQLLSCDEGCFYLDFPAYSPDGQRVAYTRYEPPSGDGPPSASSIMVLDLDINTSTEITRSEQPELVDVARWSPDGTELVLGIDVFDDNFDEAGSTIGVVDATGGAVRRLFDPSTFAYAPDWSSTDLITYSTETLAYSGSPQPAEDTWNLWTVHPDGSDARTVTDMGEGERLIQPSWSPDGRRVVATLQLGDDTNSRRIVTVDVASGDVTPITKQLGTHPRIRPAAA